MYAQMDTMQAKQQAFVSCALRDVIYAMEEAMNNALNVNQILIIHQKSTINTFTWINV